MPKSPLASKTLWINGGVLVADAIWILTQAIATGALPPTWLAYATGAVAVLNFVNRFWTDKPLSFE